MRTVDRLHYIRAWSKLGISEYDQAGLLRNAATIDRMNEAQCNGDWPCDNGERKVKECSKCQGLYAPSSLKAGGRCDDCRATARVTAIVARYPSLTVEFNGDPRGLPFSIGRATLHTCEQIQAVTCGNCGKSWCERCDPAPSALCHHCNGRGSSTAPLAPQQVPQ